MGRSGRQIDGVKIARARTAAGFTTQAAFATRLGIHAVTMNRIENGHASVSLELVEKIADATGQPRDHFLVTDEDEEAAQVDDGPSIAEMLETLIDRVVDAKLEAKLQARQAAANTRSVA